VKVNYSALGVAEAHKESHPHMLSNSIGVLTMLDRLSDKAITKSMKQIMDGEDSLFRRHGRMATMNAPPDPDLEEEEEEGDPKQAPKSGFLQLQEQAKREVDFFENKCVSWPNKQQLTTNYLVGNLNVMFKAYLKETWMPNAMKKLLASRQQIDYERYKLGIVADAPAATRELVAAREVERRVAGILTHMRDTFNREALKALQDELTTRLSSFMISFHNGGICAVTKNFDVAVHLARLENDIRSIVADAIAKIPLHFSEKIHGALTAETREVRTNNGSFSLTTNIRDLGIFLPVISTVPSSMKLYFRAKELNNNLNLLIQLSQYSEYTDAIKEKCDVYFAVVQQKIEPKAAIVVDRFMACDSSWLSLVPDAKCENVSSTILVGPFVNAVVGAFVRECPPDCAFTNLHDSVPLGTERAAAQKRLEMLNEEFSDVGGAMMAIKAAFGLSEEYVDKMTSDVVWDETAEAPASVNKPKTAEEPKTAKNS